MTATSANQPQEPPAQCMHLVAKPVAKVTGKLLNTPNEGKESLLDKKCSHPGGDHDHDGGNATDPATDPVTPVLPVKKAKQNAQTAQPSQ